MNQKLRTARSSIVILLAILGIVCLSLGLFFAVPFVSFAEDDGDDGYATLDYLDANENALWLVRYGEEGQTPLMDGADVNGALYYLENVSDGEGSHIEIRKGTSEQKNMFTPYRGVNLTIALNPEYVLEDGATLSEVYDLEKADYTKPVSGGSATASVTMQTTVDAPARTPGGESLKLKIDWTIATLCSPLTLNGNDVLAEDYNYVTVTDREYLSNVNFNELRPLIGESVVYKFHETETQLDTTFAIKYSGANGSYYNVETKEDGTYDLNSNIDVSSFDVKYLNYVARRLPAGTYELSVTTVPYTNDQGIYFGAATRVMGSFTIRKANLGDGSALDSKFSCYVPYAHVSYTGIINNTPEISLQLNNITLEAGVDYTLESADVNVGYADLTIVGAGSLEGSYTISDAFQIDPARNDWEELPGMHTWTYGSYDPDIHKIAGKPIYYSEDLSDIIFQIVKYVDSDTTETYEGLESFHYEKVVTGEDENAVEEWKLPSEIEQILANMPVGQYRLIASVEGSYPGDDITENTKNHQPLTPRGVDFEVFIGHNSWGDADDAVPNIVAWTEGQYDPEKHVITATPTFGTAFVFIRDSSNHVIYSTRPSDAEDGLGDIEILKNLKKGSYSLQAIVEADK
ncbi:MAG: hypothetical protein NC332_02150, partial [Firmicutes bacterium]|nr:hypothetical protein [Bacillota bacterium]